MKDQKNTKKSKPLYSFSRYARTYVKKSEVEGYMVSLYHTDEEGNKTYVNSYLAADGTATITKGRDGQFVLHIKLADVETVHKDKKTPAEEDDGEDVDF